MSDGDPRPTTTKTRRTRRWLIAIVVAVIVLTVAPLIAAGLFRRSVEQRAARAEAVYIEAGYATTRDEFLELYPEPTGGNAADFLPDAVAYLQIDDSNSDDLPFLRGQSRPDTPGDYTPEQYDKMRTLLDANAAAIASFEEMARIGEARYDYDYANMEALMPHLTQLRIGSHLMALKAIRAARENDAEAATEALVNIIRLSGTLKHEPATISWLVRLSILWDGFAALEDVMNLTRLGEANLQRVADAMSANCDRRFVEQAFEGDFVTGLLLFRKLAAPLQGMKTESTLTSRLVHTAGPAWEEAGIFEFAHTFMTTIEQAPMHEVVDTMQALSDDTQESMKYHLTVQIMMPGMIAGAELMPVPNAHAAIVRTATAIEAYYRANFGEDERLPATLEELVPKYLDAVPTDPYSGSPLRYTRVDSKTFRVYSVGKNRTDEQGFRRYESDDYFESDDIPLRVTMP